MFQLEEMLSFNIYSADWVDSSLVVLLNNCWYLVKLKRDFFQRWSLFKIVDCYGPVEPLKE